ncbi:mitotic checkpoint regulator, MAD2B-interacting-domain-containing protein [Crucibulum laeve]|uniref:Mitotic checkpoint regulator, MAD2B-interacting-domain-containing protein n=1 Tax=Crucibulum laeve TaxID=68775 RepID=A0A5C3MDQ7_9AGAR|nr:mitotic checkpoint regulator, MAD2B-interacting-domain-containing protein [Crucibulum laeve]
MPITMLGIEDYGSGSENDSDQESAPVVSKPKTSPTSNNPKLSLPPSKTKRPKKITIGLPNLPLPKHDNVDDLEEDRPPAKRPRTTAGAGASSLLSMLPAPKQKNPALPPPERVLGGGKGPGLVFNTSRQPSVTSKDDKFEHGGVEFGDEPVESGSAGMSGSANSDNSTASFSFLPPSLAKGRSNISLEEEKPKAHALNPSSAPAVDFFSLGTGPKLPSLPSSSTSTTSLSSLPSSAPLIATFEPPEPTPTDPYPGYYQLPSGAWAAHDSTYYGKFMKKWQSEYDAHVRALEKGYVKGFEGLDNAAVEEVDALAEMEKAKKEVQEREEKKALTKGAAGDPQAPRMKISASKMSGVARSRHQLSTLLKEAYENREALEERIAEGRRNRKEAGNKYGF